MARTRSIKSHLLQALQATQESTDPAVQAERLRILGRLYERELKQRAAKLKAATNDSKPDAEVIRALREYES